MSNRRAGKYVHSAVTGCLGVLVLVLFVLWRTHTDFGSPRWGTWPDWVVGVGTLGLLAFEIRRVYLVESRLDASWARRVLAWVEPALWQIDRQGVLRSVSGGWQIVVANDTDDLLLEWRVTAHSGEGTFVAAASSRSGDGAIPPRTHRIFDVPRQPPDELSAVPPPHYQLEASTSVRFVDRDRQAWERQNGATPRPIRYSEGLFEIPSGAPLASVARADGVDGQGFSARRVL